MLEQETEAGISLAANAGGGGVLWELQSKVRTVNSKQWKLFVKAGPTHERTKGSGERAVAGERCERTGGGTEGVETRRCWLSGLGHWSCCQ